MPSRASRPGPSRLAALTALAKNRGELDAETLRRLLGGVTSERDAVPARPRSATSRA